VMLSLVAMASLGGCEGCRKSVPVDALEARPYPSCADGSDTSEPVVLLQGELRSGPAMRPQGVAESYALLENGCLRILRVHQEWPQGTSDLEIMYDASWLPMRVWRRTLPRNHPDPLTRADVRVYDLRNDPTTMHWRKPSGELELREFRGVRPMAVVASARASLIPWILREELGVDEVADRPVLDIRQQWDEIEAVPLFRVADRYEPDLGRDVRVHTLFGSQAVYTTEEGELLGDLAGMRVEGALDTEAPAAAERYPYDARVMP